MFALYDMFVMPAALKHDVGSLRLDDRFVSVLQQLIERTVPTYALSKKNNLDDVSMALLRSAVLAGTEKPEPHAKLLGQTQLAAAGLTRLRTSVDEARRCAFEARRVAARAVGWLLPPEARQPFNERWSAAWEIAVKHMHTSMGADDELEA
jgi:hypothetical protein